MILTSRGLSGPTVPSGKPDDISLMPIQGERGPLWMDASFERGGWRGPLQKQPETKLLNWDVKPEVSSEYAELHQSNVSRFYGAPMTGHRAAQEEPAPYATTRLLSDAGRLPLPPGSGSDDSAPRRSGSCHQSELNKRSGSGAPGGSDSGASQHRGQCSETGIGNILTSSILFVVFGLKHFRSIRCIAGLCEYWIKYGRRGPGRNGRRPCEAKTLARK